MPKPVRLLLFATAREALGQGELTLAVSPQGTPLAELLAPLAKESPQFARVLRASRIVRNGRYLRARRTQIMPGDELAVHPPYSGG
ncbi:MAG: MoaD/ThiS family protein [Thermoplasmata archaeon]|nr:MoaD/ThiS family protein [Thermoplasmata archaeon]